MKGGADEKQTGCRRRRSVDLNAVFAEILSVAIKLCSITELCLCESAQRFSYLCVSRTRRNIFFRLSAAVERRGDRWQR